MVFTCRFVDGPEKSMLVLPEARVPTASKFAVESESIVAARDVATIPTDMNE